MVQQPTSLKIEWTIADEEDWMDISADHFSWCPWLPQWSVCDLYWLPSPQHHHHLPNCINASNSLATHCRGVVTMATSRGVVTMATTEIYWTPLTMGPSGSTGSWPASSPWENVTCRPVFIQTSQETQYVHTHVNTSLLNGSIKQKPPIWDWRSTGFTWYCPGPGSQTK